MKIFLPLLIAALLMGSPVRAADWKGQADAAVSLSPAAVAFIENKPDKSADEIYALTIIFYREFQKKKLRKLFSDYEKKMPDEPGIKLLQGMVLMWDHRREESRAVLAGLIAAHPDFYPAHVVLAHLDYLKKDFDRSYERARWLIARKNELSRFHFVVSLLVASGAKGILARNNLATAIPAYFEVNGYLKEAQKQMPEAAEVLYAVGTYRLLTPSIAGGDLDRAIALLEKSRRMTPQNPGVYVRLAQGYRAKGLHVIARRYLDLARDIDEQDELLQDDLSDEKIFLDAP